MSSFAMEPPLPHIAVFPFPAQGHINPALQLCQILASRGLCTVTFLNTPTAIAKLRDPGPRVRLLAVPYEDGSKDAPEAEDNLCKAVDKMGGSLEKVLVELLRCGDDQPWPPPLCIVTDVFLGWSQDVADKLGLPRFILFTPSAACLVLMLSLPSLLSTGRLPYCGGSQEELLELPGLTPALRLTDVPSHLLLDPSAFMYGYFIRHSLRIHDAAGVLINNFYELEKAAIDAATDILGLGLGDREQPHLPSATASTGLRPKLGPGSGFRGPVIPVGPLLPFNTSSCVREPSVNDDKCLQWLDKQTPRSVLYVSFGSMAELSSWQTCELAMALESSSKPFLWVLRSGGAAVELPHGFATRTKEQGLVVSWAPQLQVLAHASVAVFLSHCGWNSTMESLWSGVAMLCWPIFAEQKMNCRFVVDELKVGMEFKRSRDGVSREEVENVVRGAMESEEGKRMQNRAGVWRTEAQKAVSLGGSSFSTIDAFGRILRSLRV